MSDALDLFEAVVRVAKNIGRPSAAEKSGVHPFDERNIHSEITLVALKLFDDGYYAQATFEAFKLIENRVKTISGLEETGFGLMMNAFNESGPKIQLNALATTSDKDEQKGFRHMFAGSTAGIRNPRGHDIRNDPIDLCLDHLSVASVLLRVLEARKGPPETHVAEASRTDQRDQQPGIAGLKSDNRP
ncbi:TIGR02391 family protein [Bradyrhizobium sp. 192]|uniref:TIGR02391 family protein n=1 Tax=Bradyrhizobium sp. 192 TaxID=2782660 RepID=UPI001FFEAB72|nr:TIGR02391 family protein [Bradyrhizobium sp. 192]UPJ56241.1 TIGR02391 family protein [Bradyrhizobium sp. 192]